ncbi:hypothetical protein AA0Y32_03970 [Georgenia phoenicis]|uniref:hypothetical protein n=1 Tax=unclassified Georgenia TaxID=2626815 RepID=UPI0039B0B56C
MIIDCDSCTVRTIACDDCVVSFLLGPGRGPVPAPRDLGEDERTALAVLADNGLVPPLRLRRAGTG